MEKKKHTIDWHPGFTNAMKLEFIDNEDDLIYSAEHQLNQQPLRMDLLVIEKKTDVKILNELGSIFRRYNIFEYKSAEDALNIDVLYKVMGYACLYKSYGKTVDARKEEEITITLVRQGKPDKLMKRLAEKGCKTDNSVKGIYKITSGLPFAVQIIVLSELEQKQHVWLTALRRSIRREHLKLFLEAAKKKQRVHERQYIDAVLSVVAQANTKEIEAYRKEEADMCKELWEIMKPEIDKAVAEGMEKGMEKGMERGRAEGMEKGMITTLCGLVKDGIITLSAAAKRAGMTEAAFKKAACL